MQGQYNIANHTILPLIYKILGPNNHISIKIYYINYRLFIKKSTNKIIINV